MVAVPDIYASGGGRFVLEFHIRKSRLEQLDNVRSPDERCSPQPGPTHDFSLSMAIPHREPRDSEERCHL